MSKRPGLVEWLLTAALVLVLLGLVTCVARAEPPPGADPNSPTAKWFQSLQRPDGFGGCCSTADCHVVDYLRVVNGHYQILIKGDWVDVPDKVILHGKENPMGKPVACWINTGPDSSNIWILCFVRASET